MLKYQSTLFAALLATCGILHANTVEDVGTWPNVIRTRPALYDGLFLQSLGDLAQRYPGSTVTRLVISQGWAAPIAITTIELPKQQNFIVQVEVGSSSIASFVSKCRLDESSPDKQLARQLMGVLDGSLMWRDRVTDKVGDDESVILFEHYGKTMQGYAIKSMKGLSEAELLSIEQLVVIAKRAVQ